MGITVSNTMPVEEILKLISDKINRGNFEEFKPEYQALEEACKTLGLDLGEVYRDVGNTTINGKNVGSIVFNHKTRYLDKNDLAIIDRDGDM